MYQDISDFDDSDDMLEKVSHDAKIKQSSSTENVFFAPLSDVDFKNFKSRKEQVWFIQEINIIVCLKFQSQHIEEVQKNRCWKRQKNGRLPLSVLSNKNCKIQITKQIPFRNNVSIQRTNGKIIFPLGDTNFLYLRKTKHVQELTKTNTHCHTTIKNFCFNFF